MKTSNPFGKKYQDLILPEGTKVIDMPDPACVRNPAQAIRQALEKPIASASLHDIAAAKKAKNSSATAVILISDNTRPVPYRGEEGILLPIIEVLTKAGFRPSEILVLVATGTHREMSEAELRAIIDEKVFDLGIRVVNHNCRNAAAQTFLGHTGRGTEVYIDSEYLRADLRIATGLIESHFMAGASGGRKSVCPGIVGEKTTYIFHGAPLMADEKSRELLLEGNPVHEESLEIAKMAGVDFIANVTLNRSFHITGLFFGDLEKAHEEGVKKLISDVQVTGCGRPDVVITHAGFVGINHYQSAKCAVSSLGILKENGYLIILADNTDAGDIVGSSNYKTTLALLKTVGAQNYDRVISSPDWTFIPDQWQVQQWAKVFKRIPQDHMFFCSPQMHASGYNLYPGSDGAAVGKGAGEDFYNDCIENIMNFIQEKEGGRKLSVSYIADGPYVSVKA